MLKKNIINLKDENKYSFSKKRVMIALVVLVFIVLIIMYIYGGLVDRRF